MEKQASNYTDNGQSGQNLVTFDDPDSRPGSQVALSRRDELGRFRKQPQTITAKRVKNVKALLRKCGPAMSAKMALAMKEIVLDTNEQSSDRIAAFRVLAPYIYGKPDADTQTDSGTTFTFHFPDAQPPRELMEEAEKQTKRKGAGFLTYDKAPDR